MLSVRSNVYTSGGKKTVDFLSFMCKAFILPSHSSESSQYSTLQNKIHQ